MKSLSEVITEHKYLIDLNKIHQLIDIVSENKLNKIPLSDKKAAMFDYSKIFKHKIISDEFWEESTYDFDTIINEAKSEQVSNIKSVIADLKNRYNLSDYMFTVTDFYNKVEIVEVSKIPDFYATPNAIMVPIIERNVDIICTEMKMAGYYKVREKRYHDNETNCDWVNLYFDPIKQENIRERIEQNTQFVYHFSPIENKESIQINGLVPQNSGRIYTYNENRVYLILVPPKSKSFQKMLNNVAVNRKRNNSISGEFVIYTINMDKIPNDIEFFYDPHGENCIYTKVGIPYSSIISENIVKV